MQSQRLLPRIADSPYIVRRGGRHLSIQEVVKAQVRARYRAPDRAIPMHNQGVPARAVVIVSIGPYVVG